MTVHGILSLPNGEQMVIGRHAPVGQPPLVVVEVHTTFLALPKVYSVVLTDVEAATACHFAALFEPVQVRMGPAKFTGRLAPVGFWLSASITVTATEATVSLAFARFLALWSRTLPLAGLTALSQMLRQARDGRLPPMTWTVL